MEILLIIIFSLSLPACVTPITLALYSIFSQPVEKIYEEPVPPISDSSEIDRIERIMTPLMEDIRKNQDKMLKASDTISKKELEISKAADLDSLGILKYFWGLLEELMISFVSYLADLLIYMGGLMVYFFYYSVDLINNSGVGNLGYILGITLFIIGIFAYIIQGLNLGKNKTGNLLMLIISLELILLSIGIILINITIGLDDLTGSHICLLLLPLAGAESAIALALIIYFFQIRSDINIYSLSKGARKN